MASIKGGSLIQTSSHYVKCINLINIMSVNRQINLTETDPTDPTGVYRIQDCIAFTMLVRAYLVRLFPIQTLFSSPFRTIKLMIKAVNS